MEFKDDYRVLGVARDAGDPERRAAYDALGRGHSAGEAFTPPPSCSAESAVRGTDAAPTTTMPASCSTCKMRWRA